MIYSNKHTSLIINTYIYMCNSIYSYKENSNNSFYEENSKIHIIIQTQKSWYI